MSKELFENIIKKNKPDISTSSIKTYVDVITPFYNNNTTYKKINLNWFKDHKNIFKLIQDKPNKTKNLILCSIQAILGDEKLEEYKEEMYNLEVEYKKVINKNQKSDTQKGNWKTHDEIIKIVDTYYNNNKHLFKKNKLNDVEEQIIQNMIIMAITSGKYFEVRRSKDWYNFRIDENINENEDNYYDITDKGMVLIFNDYKTVQSKGKQTIEILKTDDIYNILKDYIEIKNDTSSKYLLTDKNGNQLSHITFNQRLNKLYGAKIGSSMIRHIKTTNDINNMAKSGVFTLEDIQNSANGMGHNIITHLQYYKND